MPFAFVFRCFLLFGFVLSSHKGRVADEEGQEGTFGNKQMRCSREQRSTIWQYFQFNSPHNCIVACEQAHSFGGCRNTELFTFCFALGSISAALSCLVYPSRCSQTLSQSYHYPPSLCHLEHVERLGHHVYFELTYLTYFVQRPTISRSGHSSVKFNVQRRILDRVTGISHSAQQHTYRVSKLHWNTRMLHVKRRNLKAKYGYCLGMQKTRMLDCVGSISHFTPYRHIEHGIRMSHALTTLHLKYALWIVNGQCWIVEVGYWNVKTSNNSKQQCCKLEFEFWRGYTAIYLED